MNHLLFLGACALLLSVPFVTPVIPPGASSAPADPTPEPAFITYKGAAGPGLGKHVVLISGDEEYRSEEALPQLGKILAAHHGFTCTVLFAVDPASGVINPEIRTNIPGIEALDSADLMIIATRFRDLPDDQMAHVDRFVRSRRPVIGLRTATHAFSLTSPTYASYSWNAPDGGFGRRILGETWIAHHGRHGHESTRGVLPPTAPPDTPHPISRGLSPNSVWGPSDVYAVTLPLPDNCTPVLLGEVLVGMNPDDAPLAGDKNNPMMPIAWTRQFPPGEEKPARVFTSTLGAATDFQADGSRRMLVNAVYWTLGMDDKIPSDGCKADLVGDYAPSAFGFGAFRKGVKPADHALDISTLNDRK